MNRDLARTTWIVGLNVVALAAVIAVLVAARTVISWLFVAILLAIALDTAVHWFEKLHFRRWQALAVVLAGVVLLVAVVVVSVVPPLVAQAKEFAERAPELLARARNSGALTWFESHFGTLESIGETVATRASSAAGPILGVLAGVATGITGILTIFVLTVFLLLFGGGVIRGILEWLPPQRRSEVREVAHRMQRTVGGYALGAMLVASINGVVTATALAIAGASFFLPIGLLAGLLALVPVIGNLAAGAMAVLVCLLTTSLKTAAIVAVVLVVYGQVENQLLQPMVQRKTIKMNPLIIFLVILLGTTLAGVLGALLALPVAGAIQVVMREMLDRRQAKWGWMAGPAPAAPGLSSTAPKA